MIAAYERHGNNQSHFANKLTWNVTGIFSVKTDLCHINLSYYSNLTEVDNIHLVLLWDLTTEEAGILEKVVVEADDVSAAQ